jgi:hypothetical protein
LYQAWLLEKGHDLAHQFDPNSNPQSANIDAIPCQPAVCNFTVVDHDLSSWTAISAPNPAKDCAMRCGLQTASAPINFFAQPLQVELPHLQLPRDGNTPNSAFEIRLTTPLTTTFNESTREDGITVRFAATPNVTITVSASQQGRRSAITSLTSTVCSLAIGVRARLEIDRVNITATVICIDGTHSESSPPVAHGLDATSLQSVDGIRSNGDMLLRLLTILSADNPHQVTLLRGVNVVSKIGVHSYPAVLTPIADCLSLSPVPLGAWSQPRVADGVLDASRQPFNADPNGAYILVWC